MNVLKIKKEYLNKLQCIEIEKRDCLMKIEELAKRMNGDEDKDAFLLSCYYNTKIEELEKKKKAFKRALHSIWVVMDAIKTAEKTEEESDKYMEKCDTVI